MSDPLIDLAQAVGRVEGKIDSLIGPSGRIEQIEAAQTRQWWVTTAIGPALLFIQAVAKKWGIMT